MSLTCEGDEVIKPSKVLSLSRKGYDYKALLGGGESYNEVWDRSVGCLERLAREQPMAVRAQLENHMSQPPSVVVKNVFPQSATSHIPCPHSLELQRGASVTSMLMSMVYIGQMLVAYQVSSARLTSPHTVAAQGRRVAVVTHGGTLHILRDRCVRDAIGTGFRGGRSGVVRNCSINTVRIHTPPPPAEAEAAAGGAAGVAGSGQADIARYVIYCTLNPIH